MTEKRIFKMTKKLMVGSVPVGGGAPVTIQSMCNTKTDQVDATVAQIHALEAAGCESSALRCRMRQRLWRWTVSRSKSRFR